MIKVALLGDSIRLVGYGTVVPKLLGEEYEVFQPAENCRFAKYTLRGLFDWQDELKGCDIVHWNNGLWDTVKNRPDNVPFSSPEEYLETMLRIAKHLKANHKVVIFATTTPVRPENPNNDNDRIAKYNALVVPELEKLGVIINDLNGLVSKDIKGYIREDDLIHLTDKGIEDCGKQVADLIRKHSK